MQEERCPLCLKIKNFDVDNQNYLRFQNTERMVCSDCSADIRHLLRPTWQIIAGRVFPKSTKNS